MFRYLGQAWCCVVVQGPLLLLVLVGQGVQASTAGCECIAGNASHMAWCGRVCSTGEVWQGFLTGERGVCKAGMELHMG
jgi:hypothetical protein